MCFLLCYICIVLGERTKKKMMLETLEHRQHQCGHKTEQALKNAAAACT